MRRLDLPKTHFHPKIRSFLFLLLGKTIANNLGLHTITLLVAGHPIPGKTDTLLA